MLRTSIRRFPPAFVGVVIPAFDEALSVEQAVHAVRRATTHPLLRQTHVVIVVVDDGSSDTTADRASDALGGVGEVLRVDLHSAGGARHAGFRVLCEASRGLDSDDVWFATTDADTLVGADWLVRQLLWWRSGVDSVAGTVVPISWREQPPIVRRRYDAHMARLGTHFGHPHVYAANLGLTESTYLAAGGIPSIPSGEDHAFWQAICQTGAVACKVDDVVVATSTRREGRAPDGFSALLRSLGEGV